ncbi:transcriptional regulator [Flavobacterium sp. HMWF030]|nr:transcriptional regulator [Flavobacterium sp. HMWF030]
MKIECKSDYIKLDSKLYPCTVSIAMDLIGGKWKAVILYHLKETDKRYSELRRDIPAITEMTLSLQLKQLENDGLLLRTVEGKKPPIKVVYSLTDFGKSCIPVLNAITEWGNKAAMRSGEFVNHKSF